MIELRAIKYGTNIAPNSFYDEYDLDVDYFYFDSYEDMYDFMNTYENTYKEFVW